MNEKAHDPAILYAEDDDNDLVLLKRAFMRAGLKNPIIAVPDGTAAIEYLAAAIRAKQESPMALPGLILLDLNMPGRSGLEVLEWIRAHQELSAVPVVILTSSNQEKDMIHAYDRGANSYVVKPNNPLDMSELAKAIVAFWLASPRDSGSSGGGTAVF